MINQIMNIREERRKQGLKLEYVAKKVGISIPFLSQIEHEKRRVSYSDYVNILDVLGYEIKIKKKDDVERVKMCNELTEMNNMFEGNDVQALEPNIQSNLSYEINVTSEKIIAALKDMDQDNDMLIKVFKFAIKYEEHAEELLVDSMAYLCEHDKELLEVLNKKLIDVITLCNKDLLKWSNEDSAWYLNWCKYDWELYKIGDKKRIEKFNITAEEDGYGDPLTVREYILKNGTAISVMYWLSGQTIEYSYDLRTEKDGIYAIKETAELLCVSDEGEIIIKDEEIMKQLSDEDMQELLRIAKDAYDFEELLSAQLNVAFGLIQATKSILPGLYGVPRTPERYREEYKREIEKFYTS